MPRANTAEAVESTRVALSKARKGGAHKDDVKLLLARQSFLSSQGEDFAVEDLPGPRARVVSADRLLSKSVKGIEALLPKVARDKDEFLDLCLARERCAANRKGVVDALEAEIGRRRS